MAHDFESYSVPLNNFISTMKKKIFAGLVFFLVSMVCVAVFFVDKPDGIRKEKEKEKEKEEDIYLKYVIE